MKIAVYAIAKNESHNVVRWLENIKDADGIFVLDTGSTDGTVSLLEQGGATVSKMSAHKPFRFDHARNEAMNLVPEEFDVLVMLDFDEMLMNGWRQIIEEQFTCDAANYTLIYDHDEQGNVTISYPRMAITRRGIGTWQYPVHEVLTVPEGTATQDITLACVHYGEPKAPGHYFDLLKMAHEDDPTCARSASYLAREYYGMQNWQMADALYRKYLELETYAPFKSDAARKIGSMCTDYYNAEWWYKQAVQYCSDIRESHCDLASFYFKHKQYEHAIASLRTALTIERPNYRMIYSDVYYGPIWCRHMLLASYQQAGNLREAIKIMREFQQPDSPMTDALRADILLLQQKVQDAFHVYSTCLGV
jgi:tetratricopeptide (TPR) repeat protein